MKTNIATLEKFLTSLERNEKVPMVKLRQAIEKKYFVYWDDLQSIRSTLLDHNKYLFELTKDYRTALRKADLENAQLIRIENRWVKNHRKSEKVKQLYLDASLTAYDITRQYPELIELFDRDIIQIDSAEEIPRLKTSKSWWKKPCFESTVSVNEIKTQFLKYVIQDLRDGTSNYKVDDECDYTFEDICPPRFYSKRKRKPIDASSWDFS